VKAARQVRRKAARKRPVPAQSGHGTSPRSPSCPPATRHRPDLPARRPRHQAARPRPHHVTPRRARPLPAPRPAAVLPRGPV